MKKDLTSHKFHRLIVLEDTGKKYFTNTIWLCQCDCGNTCEVNGSALKSGRVKSCGCLQKEHWKNKDQTKHGHATPGKRSLTYVSWYNMKQRCLNNKAKYFHRYGDRGIMICERWMVFENFLADMGERPEGMTLDRKNNEGHYEPGNCRWATPKEQANNK